MPFLVLHFALAADIINFSSKIKLLNRPIDMVVIDVAIDAEGLVFNSRQVKLDTVSPEARHRCDVSELCCQCPDAKPRRWTPSLFARFGVRPEVL